MVWIFLISAVPYLILLLIIAKYLASVGVYRPAAEGKVKVSVILPCRNEAERLPAILKDLSEQDYPVEKYELIIVDDNSTDNTGDIISSFPWSGNLKMISNKGSGKKSAIRTGTEYSSGELLLTTDADCRTGKSWISTIASFYSEYNPGMIIGAVTLKGKNSFLHRFQELEFLALQGITAGTAAAGSPVMCNGANLAFSKDAYNENSGNLHFEIASGDDMFLLQSLKKNRKNRILWLESEEAAVISATQESTWLFLKQRARWLSKTGAYDDPLIIIAGIVTFVTTVGLLSMLTGMFFVPRNGLYLAAAFLIKSIPDFLILQIISRRRNMSSLLWWFLPAQIIYPFYVMAVALFSVTGAIRWK